MASGIPGPDGSDPTQSNKPKELQTGMTKMYTAKKAPGFAQMLEHWYPGQVTSQMVKSFEQGVMQMISNSINKSKSQHKKVQQLIKERIERGD